MKTLAVAEGIEIQSRADAARFDKQRAKQGEKKCSNDDWQSPSDPDARVAKRKDGSTHLAYKAENAVDLDTKAITAAEIDHADQSDSSTWEDTLRFAVGQIAEVAGEELTQEAVADKGDLKNDVQPQIGAIGAGFRTHISEPLSPHGRTWTDKPPEQEAAFRANHRRIKGDRGKQLLRRRGEVVERTFAHLCETGGGRRTWLRGIDKVSKRYQVLALSHNLGLILRTMLGTAKPRAFALATRVRELWLTFLTTLKTLFRLPMPRLIPTWRSQPILLAL